MKPGNSNVGWRLRTLRQRRKLTLVEIARASGLDVSYLSRLERDALQHAKPKPDTINRVLDAMDATIAEREAVYHIERRPLTVVEIDAAVRGVAAEEELPKATFLANWTPADTSTADLVARVRSLPDYAYPVVPRAGVQGAAAEPKVGADLLPAY